MPTPVRLADLHLDTRLRRAAQRHWHYRLQALDTDFWRVRIAPRGRQHTRMCLAAGIHGDEPAGIEALLRLIEAGELPHGVAVDCFPVMNPEGARAGRREDGHGDDLNRQFGALTPAPAVRHFEEATNGLHYDLYVDLHEDDRTDGFYMFETGGPDTLAPVVTATLEAAGFPLEPAGHIAETIEEDGFRRFGHFEVKPGMAVNTEARTPEGGLPQAVYMHACRGAHILTFETPSRLAFDRRVAMHLAALRALFARLKRRGHVAELNPSREWLASHPRRRR